MWSRRSSAAQRRWLFSLISSPDGPQWPHAALWLWLTSGNCGRVSWPSDSFRHSANFQHMIRSISLSLLSPSIHTAHIVLASLAVRPRGPVYRDFHVGAFSFKKNNKKQSCRLMRVWLITRNKHMTSFLVFASWWGKFTLFICLFKWGLITAITPKRERWQMHYHFTANCPSAFFWCLDCLVHEDFIKEESFSLSSPTDTVWPGPEINQDPASIIRQRVSIQWNRRTFCRRSADAFHTGPHHGVIVHDEHPMSNNLSVPCSIPDCSY